MISRRKSYHLSNQSDAKLNPAATHTRVQATKTGAIYGAFAAILANGSVVSWGDPRYGGDSSAVCDQLRKVQQIQSTFGPFGGHSFAAISADGSVTSWGFRRASGGCSAIQDQVQYL